jgi:hypothetical protein
MIAWPCMLKLDGENELIYLASEHDLHSECHELIFSDDDYVIDSLGHCHSMGFTLGNLELKSVGRVLSVHAISDLLRAHEFSKASLCLTKIHFLTVAEAIKSLSN